MGINIIQHRVKRSTHGTNEVNHG